MTPLEFTALSEAHLWTRVDAGPRQLHVRHPNGTTLILVAFQGWWFIRVFQDPENPDLGKTRKIAIIPRPHSGGLLVAVQDTLHAVGPTSRAAMDRLLLEITGWVVSLNVPRQPVILERREKRVYFSETRTRVPLPDPMKIRLRNLAHVQILNRYSPMLESKGRIPLDMPHTAHDVLHLLQQIKYTQESL